MFEISHGAPLAPCTAHLCRIKVFAVSIPMPWRAPELFAAMLRIINLQGALRILTALGLTLCRAPGSERSTGGDPLGTAWSDAVRRACGGSGGGETWREEQGVEGMKGGDDPGPYGGPARGWSDAPPSGTPVAPRPGGAPEPAPAPVRNGAPERAGAHSLRAEEGGGSLGP